jgi:NCAIR mutase (PurE)-related protein
MNTANDLVAQAVGEQTHDNVPARVRDIIDRHRQTLLGLADALLAAGRSEDEVVQVIQRASESFSIKLHLETKGLEL